ncbi:MAG TPA: beta-N-acetylhexosaminidase [Actinopolymorphaceae bacterium]|nr:beta-N-acetylhexosaminidase [Actinopolymorphaceae bacterium]
MTRDQHEELATVIPWPTSYTQRPGSLRLSGEVVVAGAPELRDLVTGELGELGIRWLPASATDEASGSDATGEASGSGATGTPVVGLAVDSALPAEGYVLTVDTDGVTMRGGSPAGVFYAVQTLRQLLPPEALRRGAPHARGWELAYCHVEDAPAHGWRGCLLDVARHFMPKDFLLRLIDLLALHKYNVLQLHLTDNDGWRFESKKYPRLTQVGGWRAETRWFWEKTGDGRPHGGFYSQDDLREIVAYAGRKFITVVPEIEMPAHTFAAIAAYPHLGNDTGLAQQTSIPFTDGDVLNVEDTTVEFFQDVLAEVLDVFPSTFIHIGGDECPKGPWQASARAQEKMRALGLADEDALQSWFITQMDSWLTRNGRRLVGWDEILEGGLAPGATVMSWRGESGGVTAAKAGHDVVMAPTAPTYFDYYQSDSATEPLAIGGHNPLEDVYAYEPVPPDLAGTAEAERVLGAQFQVWTEFLPTSQAVEYMAFPRACAFAEAVWRTGKDRSYGDFMGRLNEHLRRLDALGVNYRPPSGPHPWQAGGTGRFDRTAHPQMVP